MLILLAVLAAVFVLPSPWGIVAIVVAVIVDLAEIAFGLWYARRRKPQTGMEALLGMRARALTRIDPVGRVRLQGELWQARSARPVEPGEEVRVVSLGDELTLEVEPVQQTPEIGHLPH